MIRNIFTNFSARLGAAVMSFLMLLMTTHFLGKDVRGEISVIQLAVTIVHLVSDLAGGPSLVYLVPRASLRTLLVSGSAWGIFTSLVLGYGLLYFEQIPKQYGVEVIIIGLLLSLHSLNQNILLGQQRIKAYNILYITQAFLQFAAMAIGILGFGLQQSWPYLYACFAGYGLCYLFGLFLVFRNAPAPQIRETRPVLLVLFANGFFTQAASLFLMLNLQRNYTVLKEHFGEEGNGSVGIFSTAYALAEAILLFAGSVSAVLMAKVSNEQDHAKARTSVFRLSKLSFGLTFLAVGFFLALPAGFYSWLLGKDFSPVKSVFLTLAPGTVFLSFGTVYSHYFSGAGKHYMNFISGVLALITTYIVSKLFVDQFGIGGAGLSGSLAYMVLSVFVFFAFLLIGRNVKEELPQLLPTKEDFQDLARVWKRKEK